MQIIDDDTKAIEIFKNYADSCGYFIASIKINNEVYDKVEDIDDIKVGSKIIIWFESKFDEEVKEIPDILYHVTLAKYVNKIKKSGLTPKAKNKLSFHLDRIYCAMSLKAAESIMQEFKRLDIANKISVQDYSIIQIDTHGLKVKFFKDPNATLQDGEVIGVYTHENIPREFIKEIE